jgi:hypothetical protein
MKKNWLLTIGAVALFIALTGCCAIQRHRNVSLALSYHPGLPNVGLPTTGIALPPGGLGYIVCRLAQGSPGNFETTWTLPGQPARALGATSSAMLPCTTTVTFSSPYFASWYARNVRVSANKTTYVTVCFGTAPNQACPAQ